jgi:hypothetical protein
MVPIGSQVTQAPTPVVPQEGSAFSASPGEGLAPRTGWGSCGEEVQQGDLKSGVAAQVPYQ